MVAQKDSSGAQAPQRADIWGARLQAGIIAGLLATVFSISNATLVSGSAAPEATSILIGMALIGTAVLCFTLGSFTRLRGLVPMVQDVPSAAIGAILVTLVSQRAQTGQALAPADIVVLCLTAGLAFSVSLYVFGKFGFATLMRFAPRPVLAGFLAGTGYFVILGALGICLGATLTWATLPDLFRGVGLWKLLVALSVLVALGMAQKKMSAGAATGSVIGGAILLFHLTSALMGITPTELAAQGWTASLPDGGLRWPPVSPGEISAVDFGFVLEQLFPLITMVVLATAALLMNTLALEAKVRTDIPFDHELKSLGLSNFAASLLGGLPGYHGVSTTSAALQIAPPHRAISWIAGGFVLALFIFGDIVLALMPLPIFAGFMLWVGVDFVRDWLIREVRHTPGSEAWLTIAIFLVAVGVGLFEGTIFGLAAGAALFVVNYSRLDPIRYEFTGDVFHGATEWSPSELKLLRAHGRAIVALGVQGYVFFGTAYRLRDRVQRLMKGHDLRDLIVDFSAVTGLDATAVTSFQRIADELQGTDVQVCISGASDSVIHVFARAGFAIGPGCRFETAPDLNTAVTRAEHRLLTGLSGAGSPSTQDISDILLSILQSEEATHRLKQYLTRREIAQGTAFIEQGTQASDLFFLESGAADVIVGTGAAARTVRHLRPGAIIGELAFYTSGVRTSNVRAQSACVIWTLSSAAVARLLDEDPALSSRFHAGLARILAERVTANTRLIQMLQA
ncbi:SulP family inorganic anion transporter [Primorskyibacter sp. S187A]|uniref:SulP family inorganic anion transporter n=1 Tax=Primorskyibacter sp. S187A TaxID=3415130 RepID=UPI003C7AF103